MIALLLAVSLKFLYVGIAAIVAPHLAIDAALVRSNQLTENLLPQSGSAAYRLSGIWQRFDTLWYLHIAEHGYDRPAAVVFYPLYPLLIRLLSPLFGSGIQAALAISFAASVLLYWALFRLAELEFDRRVAWRAAAVLAAWPASFILFAGYPDSLVLALTVSSLYWARTGRTGLSAMAAFLGTLAKAAGVAVAVPLVVFAVTRKSWRMAIPAAAAAAGSLGFPGYLRWRGLPNLPETYAEAWRTSIVPPWRTAGDVLERIGSGDLLLLYNAAMLALVLLLCISKPRPAAYFAFALALLVLLLMKRTDPLLQSTSRYLVAAFPAYVNLARSRVPVGVLSPLAALNLWLMLLYFSWWLVV